MKKSIKSSEFCSSLLIIQAGMLTRSELAGFKVLYTRHNNPLFIINHSWISTLMHYIIYFAHGMQQPIFETNFEATELVIKVFSMRFTEIGS